jgi:hypothetical protein
VTGDCLASPRFRRSGDIFLVMVVAAGLEPFFYSVGPHRVCWRHGGPGAITDCHENISHLDITARAAHVHGVLSEPLNPSDARRLIREIIENGNVAFSGHAQEELDKDDLTTTDVLNMLRGGIVEPAEFEGGSWRYRVRTGRMCVVVAFRSETELRIVTAWRFKP